MRSTTLFVILFLCCFTRALGQKGRLFSTDTELSSSLINQVFQDSNGTIWITTEDGLNKFDGAKMKVFKHQKGDATTVLDNYSRAIFEDLKGNLFFGFINGLQQYDHKNQSFSQVSLYNNSRKEVFPHIFSMIQRKNGDILIATSGEGIFKLHTKEGTIYGQQLTGLTPTRFIYKLFEDHDENLWIITQNKGLYKYDVDKKSTHYFQYDEPDGNITSIVEDHHHTLYVGKLNGGLYAYDASNNIFKKIKDPYNDNLPIKTLYLTEKKQLLIGSDGCGIKSFNTDTQQIIASNFGISQFNLSKAKVHSIIIDNTGNLWLGIFQKGLLQVPPTANKFHYIGNKSFEKNLIGSNYITALYKDKQHTLWVGTDGDGIYGIREDGHTIHYRSGINTTILCVYEDSHYNLWVGTYLNGLALVDKIHGTFNYMDNLSGSQSQKVEHIYDITEDTQNNLWIATMGSGIYSMNIDSGKISNYGFIEESETPVDAKENRLFNNWVNCLHLGTNNTLYIGTYAGLCALNLSNGSFIDTLGANHILDTKVINTIYEDTLGNLWIGTTDGIFYKEVNNQKLIHYTDSDGLPSNFICAIKEDNDHHLWISTHYGISKFDMTKKQFTNYFYNDGLQGNEFTKGAACNDYESNLYFGGINGITYFDPEHITDEGKIPDLKITALYLNNKEVVKGTKSGKNNILNDQISKVKNINLAYNDNTFAIEFATSNYIESERLTYFYSMNNEKWNQLPQGVNLATFNDLPPGTYNIKIKAKEYKTFSPEKSISIIIRNPWYLTPLAIAIYICIVLSIASAIIILYRQKFKTREKIREQNYINQIHEAKLQFFTNIAHEIKTPISLLANPLRKLIVTDTDVKRQYSYKIMKRNCDRIMLLIDQLMDMRKIDAGQIQMKFQKTEIITLIEEMASLFEDQREDKNIEFEFEHELPFLFVDVDPRYFDKIIQNILSNAYKFTPNNGKIKIELSLCELAHKEDTLQIKIIDNGKGIEEKDTTHIFDRFYQSPGNITKGTGIGLHLTKSIVKSHHGTIKAENNLDKKGSCFIIEIPVKNSLLSNSDKFEESINTTNSLDEYQPIPIITDLSIKNEKNKNKSKYKILIVDDDAEMRAYLTKEFSEHYHVSQSKNGKEALSMILKTPYDLVISDVKMPELDGISLCKKIKQHININHIPVILLTAKSREKDNLEGLNIGADAYLPKPFNLQILTKTVQNLIHNRELLKNTYRGNQIPEEQLDKISIKSSDEKLIQKIITVINENLNNPELNVEMLASEIGLSRVHLYRKLKELTNQSARDLIKNIRLKQAGILLSDKKLTISEVTYATGFSNISKFSSSFKNFYGISPKAYRETKLNLKEEESLNSFDLDLQQETVRLVE
ncbi:hybrid sensor histidine kinase/response regulator [Neptunitalea chrysea]|uniref:histidine kinase n=1 Tax=Neptunitalea chrysea TaxID=1647581 RepID=A0A9W6B3R3_9FLAO|nr:two-component regulator propeller domain-containing protein [Neptunitalea chrysea]GLB51865.1 hybrid sensor histidine kinase/response regulator [Neptunitalea chrysea]